jgi:hypothetical protein
MPYSKRTLERLSPQSWELKLSVDSTVIESLKWVWTAGVSVEDGPNESRIAIAPAAHTQVGMPDGDRTGSHSYAPKLTSGKSGIPVSEFESVLDQWEQECRQISSVFDSSVMGRRRDLERQRSEEESKAENRQNVETYLDSLITDDPDP